jgi:hypothetical protein
VFPSPRTSVATGESSLVRNDDIVGGEGRNL